MITHSEIATNDLKGLIHQQRIILGGNKKLKIYGSLHCRSGKRLKKENRVFFQWEQEAVNLGYRPCGHCMTENYKIWKKNHELF